MVTLLMTATFRPSSEAGLLAVRDPETRLQQYLNAFDFYCTLVPDVVDGIVLADNSLEGHPEDAERFEARALARNVPLELVRCPPTPAAFGRGEGEARIIDHAMSTSRRLANVEQAVWKVTGRYQVRNLARLIVGAPVCDLYLNVRRHPIVWGDTYTFAFTRLGWERYLSADARRAAGVVADPASPMEMSWGRIVMDVSRRDPAVVPRFRREPKVHGVRGMDGRSYNGWRQRAKWWVRSAQRYVAPRLWL